MALNKSGINDNLRTAQTPDLLIVDRSPRAQLTDLVIRRPAGRNDKRQASESQLTRLAKLLGTRRLSGRTWAGGEDLRIDRLEHADYAMLEGMSISTCYRHTVNLLKVAFIGGNTFDSASYMGAVEALRTSLGALVKPQKVGTQSIIRDVDVIAESAGITPDDRAHRLRHLVAVKAAREAVKSALVKAAAKSAVHHNGPIIKRLGRKAAPPKPSTNGTSTSRVPVHA